MDYVLLHVLWSIITLVFKLKIDFKNRYKSQK